MDSVKRVLTGALVSGVAFLATSSVVTAAEAVSVRLRWIAQAQFAGVYVAKKKGFYEEAGLDVTINPGGPNFSAESLVASGADTFGVASGTDGMLFAREKKLPVVAIAMSQQTSPYAFVAHTDSGINSLKDFKGKTVATWFTGSQYNLFTALAHEGVGQSDLKIVSQPFSMQPFIARQFDVATVTLFNELMTLNEQGVNVKVFRADESGVLGQEDAIITSEKTIAEKPKVVQAFLNATIKGWKYAIKNKSEAIDIVMAAGSGLVRKHQEDMLDEIAKLLLEKAGTEKGIGYIDMTTATTVRDNLLKFGVLKGPVDVKAAFNAQFWEKVPTEDKHL